MIAAAKDISSTDSLTSATGTIRVLIAAGGTGGHVYPAISIADALKELHPDTEILFVGTRDRMEWSAVPKAGYEIESVWISGFHRRLTPQNLLFPVKLLTSLLQSYRILKRFNPDVVIACGGFASGPVGWVAAKTGIPLILQEQNSYPGVTNRLLAKHADAIFTAFDAASDYLPGDKIQVTGNPVRSELKDKTREKGLQYFSFDSDKPVLLILGGSGGAKTLNNAVSKHLEKLHDQLELQIIWQCGKRYYSDLKKEIDANEFPNLRLLEYIDNMASAYSAADLVVSRAGAGSCSELMLTGSPAILVPSPNVAGDHQTKNAKAMVEHGAAILLKDDKAEEQLYHAVDTMIQDKEQLTDMRKAALSLAKPGAAQVIAKEIIKRSKQYA